VAGILGRRGEENGLTSQWGIPAQPTIGWRERERIAERNRALLWMELISGRLEFESRPNEAQVQFSNFCNMSCIMCYDGGNPPLVAMKPHVLGRLATQIAPDLSLIVPHDASEPLLVTWQETLRLAKENSVRLALTTNGQFFDEQAFLEAKDVLDMVALSIDSHVPEIYAKIRTGSKPDAVFENLATIARLCSEHKIEFFVQIVFMTLNAAMLPETISFMADAGVSAVNVIPMIDSNGRSGHLDALTHLSAEWIETTKQSCVSVARERELFLGWNLREAERFDFRPPQTKIVESGMRRQSNWWDERMERAVPGFCRYVYNRVRIRANGEVAPCPMATHGELSFGTLARQDFDEIWNGPSAQDLRRAHHCADYPSICSTCPLTRTVPAKTTMEFVEVVDHVGGTVDASLVTEDPVHMARCDEMPAFRVSGANGEVARWLVIFSLAGELEEIHSREVPHGGGTGAEIEIGDVLWNLLRPNLGYWWIVAGLGADGSVRQRSAEVRCVIRHQALPRIAGSTLGYPDQDHLPPIDLGKDRRIGWDGIGAIEPIVRTRGVPEMPRTRFSRQENGQRSSRTQETRKEPA
jgi:radical SAM protein with 4Fe4S-binding SPASM domain